jgi:predicted RNase H-like nuclease (RuvC/YqgF family)
VPDEDNLGTVMQELGEMITQLTARFEALRALLEQNGTIEHSELEAKASEFLHIHCERVQERIEAWIAQREIRRLERLLEEYDGEVQ